MPDFGSSTKRHFSLASGTCALAQCGDEDMTNAARPKRPGRRMRRSSSVMYCTNVAPNRQHFDCPRKRLLQFFIAMGTVSRLTRTLRGRCRGEGKFAPLNQDEVANVNERVRQIREDTDRIAPKHKVKTHNDAPGDAPVPKRHGNDTFTLSFRGDPLDDETHRKNQVSDQAENDEIIPVQAEEAMLPADPCCSDDE